jgi:ATP-dependent helicase/nuclease subunit B
MAKRPTVYTIPPGAPFLETLADALLQGAIIPGWPDLADPFSLARGTILLPTRRACRALVDVFQARLGTTLLPAVRPLGDVEEADLIGIDEDRPDGLETPLAIEGFHRRMVLTRLVLAWAEGMARAVQPVLVPASPADAAHLAGELARLMDTFATEDIPIDAIRTILPENLQQHWQITLTFLRIATEHWPAVLAERGRVDPAERRRRLMDAEAARFAAEPDRPVIAAGSTGSIPTTAKLLDTLARLPRGAVVLPGLDRHLSADVFERLRLDDVEGSPSHPQFGLARLSHRLSFDDPADVPVLGAPPPDLVQRERLISEAMRPAFSTDAWAGLTDADRDAFAEGLQDAALLVAANEQEEALAIAGLLRETVGTPGATAALLTPDRTLARRVAGELKRFGLEVDDSGGVPLSETPAGLFARLIADAASQKLSPSALVSLLKHPFATFGLDPTLARRAASALERLVLRGPAPPPGVVGLVQGANARAAIRQTSDVRQSDAARGLSDAEVASALDLASRIEARLGRLEQVLGDGRTIAFQTLVDVHAQTIATCRETPQTVALRPEDGLGDLEIYLAEAGDRAAGDLSISPAAYAELFLALMRGRPARGRPQSESRVRIYGLMEARLVRHDRLVLGGLIEGVWPQGTTTDPWLSRSMRIAVNLPVPERRIGLSAHDFAQAMGTRDVWLTRSAKREGAPTVPSRWVSRLRAVLGEQRFAALSERGEARLRATRLIDQRPPVGRIARPAPTPPVRVRPRQLSISEIETFVRDPYSIYARHILKLSPFEEIGEEPGASEKGELFHAALATFADEVSRGAPADASRLIALAEKSFAELAAPDLVTFWRPRFARIAAAIAAFETARRREGATIHVEIKGKLTWLQPGGDFTLSGRADRIEVARDGTLAIIDYKTGRVPSKKEVTKAFSPQLPLEAAMACAGAFAEQGIAGGGALGELLYVKLSGGNPAIKDTAIVGDVSQNELALSTLEGLKDLLARFDFPDQPYLSLQHPTFRNRFGRYDHLARVAEWSLGEDEAGAT